MCKHVSYDSQIQCIACGTGMCKTSRIRKFLLTHVTSIWFVTFVTRVSVCVWLDLWLYQMPLYKYRICVAFHQYV